MRGKRIDQHLKASKEELLAKYKTGEHTINKFPNHVLVDGILYRGQRQRTLVKPVNGKYKIRSKGIEYNLTLKELILPMYSITDQVDNDIKAKTRVKTDDQKNRNDICKDYNVSFTTFKEWLKRRKIDIDDLTMDQIVEKLKEREYKIKLKKATSIPFLCEKEGVNYRSYQNYLRNRNLKIGEISYYGHIKMIAEFKKV
jgi:hypothetical protein